MTSDLHSRLTCGFTSRHSAEGVCTPKMPGEPMRASSPAAPGGLPVQTSDPALDAGTAQRSLDGQPPSSGAARVLPSLRRTPLPPEAAMDLRARLLRPANPTPPAVVAGLLTRSMVKAVSAPEDGTIGSLPHAGDPDRATGRVRRPARRAPRAGRRRAGTP